MHKNSYCRLVSYVFLLSAVFLLLISRFALFNMKKRRFYSYGIEEQESGKRLKQRDIQLKKGATIKIIAPSAFYSESVC